MAAPWAQQQTPSIGPPGTAVDITKGVFAGSTAVVVSQNRTAVVVRLLTSTDRHFAPGEQATVEYDELRRV